MTIEMETKTMLDEKGSPVITVATDALEVHVSRSLIDGVPYVQIDTRAPGVVRVELNDGDLWDADPEQDVPAMLDGFDILMPRDEPEPVLKCLSCGEYVTPGKIRVTLREHVADAKLHTLECAAVTT